ncbi:MAG: hypothetical protein MJ061_02580 [Mailhella sp.]|nr:hypothetical protein [Mailhella sp.]
MMISLLLGKQIAAMLLMVFMGFLVVRLRLLSAQDSRILSALTLYLIGPCMIIDAFQIDCTPEKLQALLLSIGAGAFVQILCLGFDALARRPLRLDAVERTSSIYTNSGNLIIPVVAYVLGPEWVLYTCGYMMFQVVLFWTHCVSVLRGGSGFDIRKILLNINVLCIFGGLILFVTGIRLPEVASIAVRSVGLMIGPVSMIVTGMLIGSMDFSRLLAYRKLPAVVLLRLVIYPLLTLCALWASGLQGLVENGERILLIVFLAAAAPSASTVTQMAHLYGNNGEYASLIAVVSTLLCVITMPALVWLFQLAIG